MSAEQLLITCFRELNDARSLLTALMGHPTVNQARVFELLVALRKITAKVQHLERLAAGMEEPKEGE